MLALSWELHLEELNVHLHMQLDRTVKRYEEKNLESRKVFEWFKKHVLDFKLEPSIDHHELVSFFEFLLIVCLWKYTFLFYEESLSTPLVYVA